MIEVISIQPENNAQYQLMKSLPSYVLIVIAMLSSTSIFAQLVPPSMVPDGVYGSQPISPDSAKYHDGSLETICGKVTGTHVGKTGVMMLNFGAPFPDNSFTAVIFTDDAPKFKNVEEYKGKTICVIGRIKTYKGKPEIVLKETSQLREQ